MKFTREDVVNYFEFKITREDIDILNKLNNVSDCMSDYLYYLLSKNDYILDVLSTHMINDYEDFIDGIIFYADEYYNKYADEEEIKNHNKDYFIQIGVYNCDKFYIDIIESTLQVELWR